MISRYLEVIPVSVREIAETSRKSRARVPNLVPETSAKFYSYFTFQTTSGHSGAIGWSLNFESDLIWPVAGPGQAKIIIISSLNKIKNKSKNSKWYRDISNKLRSQFGTFGSNLITSGNSWASRILYLALRPSKKQQVNKQNGNSELAAHFLPDSVANIIAPLTLSNLIDINAIVTLISKIVPLITIIVASISSEIPIVRFATWLVCILYRPI